MPDEEAVITDIEFEDYVIVESSHFLYANNLNERECINYTFEGATSLTIELTYQTEGVSYDYIYIYDDENSTIPYGGLKNRYGGVVKKTKL